MVDWNNRPYPRAFGEWDMDTDYWRGWVEVDADTRVELGTFEHVSELQVALDRWLTKGISMQYVGDAIQTVISSAIDEGVPTKEIAFELAKFLALLSYANGNSKDGILNAVSQMLDTVYARAEVMEASGEFSPN